MSLFFTLLGFAALLALAAWLCLRGALAPALSPLAAASAVILVLTLGGCLGLLRPAGFLLYAAALAALCDLALHAHRAFWAEFFCPGVLLFCAAGVGVIALFAVRQPLFLEWDEFSFWGTAAKLVKLDNELYTTAPIGWNWTATQKPGLIVFEYFLQFFGPFAEWRVLAALDVLQFAVFAALLAPLPRRRWATAVPTALAAFLVPAAMVLYRALEVPCSLYMNAHSDVPMGILFAGAVFTAWYDARGRRLCWPTLLALAALTLTRDTALPLAMIAAVLAIADWLFCAPLALTGRRRAVWSLAALAAPLLCFLGWAAYLKLRVNVNALEVTTDGSMGMREMLVRGVSELAGVGRTEKFSRIMGMMASNFVRLRITVFGSGAVVAALILGLVALAWLCAGPGALRRRCGWFALLSSLGFVAFYIFTGFCYVYVFREIESANLTGYERYIYPYYIGWMLAALSLLAAAAAAPAKRFFGLAGGALLALVLLLSWRCGRLVTPQTSFIDYGSGYDYVRQVSQRQAAEVKTMTAADAGSIFFVSQGDDGRQWFLYCCELLPRQLDYSFGGGTLGDPALTQDAGVTAMTPAQLCSYLTQKGCAYLFVHECDPLFVSSYGTLFSDGLAAADDSSALYEIEGSGAQMHFVLRGGVALG